MDPRSVPCFTGRYFTPERPITLEDLERRRRIESYENEVMRWGRECEAEARAAYEKKTT